MGALFGLLILVVLFRSVFRKRKGRPYNKKALILLLLLILAGGYASGANHRTEEAKPKEKISAVTSPAGEEKQKTSATPTEAAAERKEVSAGQPEQTQSEPTQPEPTQAAISSAAGLTYSGTPYTEVNGNQPFFSKEERTTEVFERYSGLDALGRCGVAYANICRELMPKEERGKIGMVKPSGWHTVKYAGIDGNYLYNRCHLIGYQLAGENANEKNLITGTRYMNTEGMLPFENRIAEYVKATGHHVLYRVTPVFEQTNLLASGVLLEAQSVEDEGLHFCVYCYNVQPGITISYADGSSSGPEYTGNSAVQKQAENTQAVQTPSAAAPSAAAAAPETSQVQNTQEYVVNKNTKKFHLPSCRMVRRIKPGNREDVSGSKDHLISEGYAPCQVCNP